MARIVSCSTRMRYEDCVLLRKIAEGASSEIFLAQAREGGPPFAVKRLREDLAADSNLARRFLRESSLLASVQSDFLVTYLAAFEDERRIPCIAMEWIEAKTLRSRLNEGTFPFEDAMLMADGALRGLEALHQEGIVHGDVKPDNIFFDPKGIGGRADRKTVLADLGLAKVEGFARLTRTGTVAGTPIYMAPEVLTQGLVTPQSDLYSFGICLFEALHGAPPFVATKKHPGALIGEIAFGKRPKVHEALPDLDLSVASALERALDVDPRKRFEDAAAYRAAMNIDFAPRMDS